MKEFLARNKSKLLIVASLICFVAGFGASLLFDYAENLRIDRESVELKPDLTINYDELAVASDFLAKLDGELLTDPQISTTEIGDTTVTFEYLNRRHRPRSYTFTVQVVDTVAPRIYGGVQYTVARGYQGDLTNLMLSGDEVDDHPHREIIGEYDLDKPGNYQVEYAITDSSSNRATHPFTLEVVQPDPDASEDPPDTAEPLPIDAVIKQYKTATTKIGIDVSQWQGEIDWQKVKNAGVEFAFLRIGYQSGYGGEYVLDPFFQQNLTNAKQVKLPVGVYFYSYADSVAEAQKQAKWGKTQLGGAEIELGVAFDWEDWANFNSTGMSFRTINHVANAFLDTLAESEYRGLLYSSKVYLEHVWRPERYPVWLAQYYDYVTYDGEYSVWQMSSSGRVPGINGDVDLDIMYLDN